MNYATWNLRPIGDGYLDGPEMNIFQRGGKAEPIWTNGAVEKGATILSKVEGDLTGLEEWNVVEISRAEAEKFIADNFTPYVDEDGTEHSLEKILTILD